MKTSLKIISIFEIVVGYFIFMATFIKYDTHSNNEGFAIQMRVIVFVLGLACFFRTISKKYFGTYVPIVFNLYFIILSCDFYFRINNIISPFCFMAISLASMATLLVFARKINVDILKNLGLI